MILSRGEAKKYVKGDEARAKLLNGSRRVYEAVASAYGPVSGNVAIQKNLGIVVTHDGVSVAREVHIKDEAEDIGAGLLVQASEKSNAISGDGTSATVMLGYHIFNKANKRVAAGANAMALRRGIESAGLFIKQQLDEKAKTVPDSSLADIASISASDPEIGQLVADTILKVKGVGVSVEEWNGIGVDQEIIDGIYFEKGWTLPHFVNERASEECVLESTSILISEKHMKQNQDIIPILEMVYDKTEHKSVVIIGKVTDKALETCALTNVQGKVRVCVVNPPVYGDQELPFLEDLATMTGGMVVTKDMPAEKVDFMYLGGAKKVVVARNSTTIFGAEGASEDVRMRVALIEEQLKSDKYTAFQRERMEMRLSKLNGKIGIIKVGAPTEIEMREIIDRVEDAVHATRAASEEGVIPGGATALVKIWENVTIPVGLEGDELEGFLVVKEACYEPFKQLMENAGEDGGYRLSQLLNSKFGAGFDVKNMTEKPIDLGKAGIIDPVKVIKSVVENACSFAGVAITIPYIITIDRDWQLEQLTMNKATQG